MFFALQEQHLQLLAADSAVPGLNRNLAYMNKQVNPPNHVVRYFDSWARTVFARRRQTASESQHLISLRDTLLPKLISGEIRIGDAHELVADVA